MHVIDSRISHRTELGADTWLVGLTGKPIGEDARPGQFVQVRFPGSRELLLPRSFSVLGAGDRCVRSDIADVELLVRIVGAGTRRLCEMGQDGLVQLSGPIGNVFEVAGHVQHLYLVAGGAGFAPMYFLAADLSRLRRDLAIDFFYGARTSDELAGRELMKRLDVGRHWTTDDGSSGYKGFVTDALSKALEDAGGKGALVCGCGPAPMLRALQRIVRKHGVPCLLSLENYMACGTGVCQGCAVKVATAGSPEYRRVCRDGAVFDADAVEILELPPK